MFLSRRKIRNISIIFSLVFLLMLLRLGHLQIVEGEYYHRLSEGNRIAHRPITSSRGRIWIMDNGVYQIAVSNKLAYTVSVIPANIIGRQQEEAIAQRLEEIVSIPAEEILEKIRQGPSAGPVRIKRNLTPEEMVCLEEHHRYLPGVIIENTPVRDYVYNTSLAHILGYIGEVSIEELRRLSTQGIRAGDLIGKTGLERYYDFILRGQDGTHSIEVNNRRIEVDTLDIIPPEQGDDLYLTIDLQLQDLLETLLEEQVKDLQLKAMEDPESRGGPSGAVAAVLEVDTGRVLAISSYPNFDLNHFSGSIDREVLHELQNNRYQPFLDRTIQINPPPGSVFKIVSGLAGLEFLEIDPAEKLFYCPGFFELGGTRWRCWNTGGHADMSFDEAVAHSCNVSFYQMGRMLHQEEREGIQYIARELGFGSLTGIDLPGEKPGLVPDDEWKRYYRGEPWMPGDTINLSIGQGSLLVTPLQVVNMVAAIANGGSLMQPYIVEKAVAQSGEITLKNEPTILNDVNICPSSIESIQKALYDVTLYGTGARLLGDFPVQVAGKTGTAQTASAHDSPNHGWFAGYAPADDPEIAFVVFIEHGNDSRHAIPVAKGILASYFGIEEGGQEE